MTMFSAPVGGASFVTNRPPLRSEGWSTPGAEEGGTVCDQASRITRIKIWNEH